MNSCKWTNIDDIICTLDCVFIMFNNNKSITQITQIFESCD